MMHFSEHKPLVKWCMTGICNYGLYTKGPVFMHSGGVLSRQLGIFSAALEAGEAPASAAALATASG